MVRLGGSKVTLYRYILSHIAVLYDTTYYRIIGSETDYKEDVIRGVPATRDTDG